MRILVLVAIVSLAFNDLYPLLPVGELSNDAFIYALPLLLLHFLRAPAAITAPISLALLIIALGIALIVGVGTNYGAIASAYFKGRSGVSRVATQGLALGFGLLLTLVFYNVAIRGFLPIISRGARIALLLMAAVGGLELASWFHVPLVSETYRALSAVIHAGSQPDYPHRLRMTAFEVSWAGVMLTFFFPFGIIGLSPRGWRLPAYIVLVLGLTALTQSRTALLVVGFQILFLTCMVLRRRFDLIVHAVAATCLALILLFLSPSLQERVGTAAHNMIEYGSLTAQMDDLAGENVSNVTRLASIRAALSMFRARPFFGVGFGQFGFNYPGHLQADDFRSHEVRQYVTDAEEVWPPIYSVHARLLAETGIVGYAIWLAILLPGLIRGIVNADMRSPEGRAHLAVAMTLGGWLLLGTSIDSFRSFGGWIAVGVASALLPRRNV